MSAERTLQAFYFSLGDCVSISAERERGFIKTPVAVSVKRESFAGVYTLIGKRTGKAQKGKVIPKKIFLKVAERKGVKNFWNFENEQPRAAAQSCDRFRGLFVYDLVRGLWVRVVVYRAVPLRLSVGLVGCPRAYSLPGLAPVVFCPAAVAVPAVACRAPSGGLSLYSVGNYIP